MIWPRPSEPWWSSDQEPRKRQSPPTTSATHAARITPNPRSHSEHAEDRLGDRRVQCRCETERENPARVERIDDAVVPEPRRGVVGVAFALVLLADCVLVDVADHRENGRGLLATHH